MPVLESDLRRQLENVIIEAREVAEAAARSKLTNLGVAAPEAFNDRDREIRNRLRARGRRATAEGKAIVDQQQVAVVERDDLGIRRGLVIHDVLGRLDWLGAPKLVVVSLDVRLFPVETVARPVEPAEQTRAASR